MTEKTALVLGATGLVGSALLDQLNTDPRYAKIKVLVRRAITNVDQYPKLEAIELADFQQMQSIADKLQADDVFCTLGTTMKKAGSKAAFYSVDFTYPFALAQIALQQGAQHFNIVTANGANPESKIFYNRVKGEIEQALQGLGYQRLTILRPSLLLGERQEFRLGESVAQAFSGFLALILPARLKPIHATTVAKAMVNLAFRDDTGVKVIESEIIRQIAEQ